MDKITHPHIIFATSYLWVKTDVGGWEALPMVIPPGVSDVCRELDAARGRFLAMHGSCQCLDDLRQQAGQHYRRAAEDFYRGRDCADSLAAFHAAACEFDAAAGRAEAVASVLAQIAIERRTLAAAVARLTCMKGASQ
jgi:hypothetical protein